MCWGLYNGSDIDKRCHQETEKYRTILEKLSAADNGSFVFVRHILFVVLISSTAFQSSLFHSYRTLVLICQRSRDSIMFVKCIWFQYQMHPLIAAPSVPSLAPHRAAHCHGKRLQLVHCEEHGVFKLRCQRLKGRSALRQWRLLCAWNRLANRRRLAICKKPFRNMMGVLPQA